MLLKKRFPTVPWGWAGIREEEGGKRQEGALPLLCQSVSRGRNDHSQGTPPPPSPPPHPHGTKKQRIMIVFNMLILMQDPEQLTFEAQDY